MTAAKRVDFFVAGVQKGGTTALDALLRLHPGVAMAHTKEPHFFDDDDVDWRSPDYGRYHAHFDPFDGSRVFGEATPILTYWPRALERVRAYNPAARLVICLRHPTFRAFSQWRMERHRGAEALAFHEAIVARRARTMPGGVHRVFSYAERGFYADQIARAHDLFSREHVHVLRTDRLWLEPAATMRGVCDFLGIAHGDDTSYRTRYRVTVDARSIGDLSSQDRATLDRMYVADITQTAELTGLDLVDWLDPAYAEPMATSLAATDPRGSESPQNSQTR